jgi:hypothetical protein
MYAGLHVKCQIFSYDEKKTVWRNRFGRGFGPVFRQNTERMIE